MAESPKWGAGDVRRGCTSSAKHILQISAVLSDATIKKQKHPYRRRRRTFQKASEQSKHVEGTHNIENTDAVTISQTCIVDKSKCLENIVEEPKLYDDQDQNKVIMPEADEANEKANRIPLDFSLPSLICLLTYLLLHNAIIVVCLFVVVTKALYLACMNSISMSEAMLGKVMEDACRTKELVTMLVREECVPIKHDFKSMKPELYNSVCKKINKLALLFTGPHRFKDFY